MLYLVIKLIIGLYFMGFAFGVYYKLSNPERPIKWLHVANPMKWMSILISSALMYFVPPHIVEQLCLRMYDDECGGVCMKQGFCHDCGCAMPAKAFDPHASCSQGNWGPMIMDAEEYRKHRINFPIKIKVTYV